MLGGEVSMENNCGVVIRSMKGENTVMCGGWRTESTKTNWMSEWTKTGYMMTGMTNAMNRGVFHHQTLLIAWNKEYI